ncbi:MAG TPA: hypothetical protein VFX59_00775, partial [Polyangiales bacterium]|nr:hypothetical protein [Polyangiales bacterium]
MEDAVESVHGVHARATLEGPAVIEAVPAPARLGMIAGGVLTSYRASLVERDIWDHVRARFAQRGPREAEWLDAVTHHDWVDVEAYVTLLDAIADTMGLDALRNLV